MDFEQTVNQLIGNTGIYNDAGDDCTIETIALILAAHHKGLEQAELASRVDELKHSLYKGYFIPEMEAYAEGRLSQLTQSKSNDKEHVK